MLAIARFTLYKLFEPAFLCLLLLGIVLAYLGSGSQNFDLAIIGTSVKDKGNLNLGAFFLLSLSLVIGVFVGATEIPRDISSRMITIYLSKPISRTKYVIGRFLGTWFLSSLYYIIWLTLLLIIQYFNDSYIFNIKSFTLNYLYIFALAPISAISVAVSTYLEDIAAMIITFVITGISFSMVFVLIISVFLGDAELKKLVLLVYYMMPNASYLFRNFESVYQIIAFIFYAGSLTCMFLKVGTVHFQDKDLC